MGQGRGNRAAREPCQRPVIPKIVEEQDEAIRRLADIEIAELKAQQDDEALDDLPSDSIDEDYRPLPQMPPRTRQRG